MAMEQIDVAVDPNQVVLEAQFDLELEVQHWENPLEQWERDLIQRNDLEAAWAAQEVAEAAERRRANRRARRVADRARKAQIRERARLMGRLQNPGLGEGAT